MSPNSLHLTAPIFKIGFLLFLLRAALILLILRPVGQVTSIVGGSVGEIAVLVGGTMFQMIVHHFI